MRSIGDIRLLGDQCLVRCLGTADRSGLIWIPLSAQEARRIHQSGGDYLHRGEVLACGPGDKMLEGWCVNVDCEFRTEPVNRLVTAKNWRCSSCGDELEVWRDTRNRKPPFDTVYPGSINRAEMPVKPGDIVLYENRRDAEVHPRRFPSLDLTNEDELVILLAEQHVLAVFETDEESMPAELPE